MSVSSNPAAFLRRAKRIGVPAEAIARFMELASEVGSPLIITLNGNSRFAGENVAQFSEKENLPGFGFPATIRLCRNRDGFFIKRNIFTSDVVISSYFEKEG
jgi:hypothetical protein